MNQPESILDLPEISGCYLFPQPRYVGNPFVVSVGDVELACYHHVVDADNFTVVHFHGNGEAVADYVPDMALDFAELGLNSLFVEYRQYGQSTGAAKLVAMLGDGQTAVEAAALPPEKVIVFGRSIGSLYAIELAHRLPSVAGLILESGIADATERFLARADLSSSHLTEDEIAAQAKQHFDHKLKLSEYVGPLLTMHTEHDGLIDISHAERNHRWAASRQKRLVRFAMGDHNSILGRNRDEYFKAIGSFLKCCKTT